MCLFVTVAGLVCASPTVWTPVRTLTTTAPTAIPTSVPTNDSHQESTYTHFLTIKYRLSEYLPYFVLMKVPF